LLKIIQLKSEDEPSENFKFLGDNFSSMTASSASNPSSEDILEQI
jgi:hypothetical protein